MHYPQGARENPQVISTSALLRSSIAERNSSVVSLLGSTAGGDQEACIKDKAFLRALENGGMSGDMVFRRVDKAIEKRGAEASAADVALWQATLGQAVMQRRAMIAPKARKRDNEAVR